MREGKFPSDDKELQQAFINGEFDNEDLIKLIPGVRRDAEKIYADRSFDVAAQSTQAKTRSGASGLGSEDSPYSNVADRGITGPENQGESTFWQQNILTEPIDLTGLYNAETGDMGGNASLIGVGVNSSGDRVVTVSTMSVVPDPEKYDTNGTMELTRSKDIVIKPGDQYYETLAIQDDKRIITDLEKRYKEKGFRDRGF